MTVNVINQLDNWRDITGSIEVRGVAATDPAWAQISSGPFYAWRFAVDDIIWMCYHIPHDFVPNTEIHLHVHWLPDGTNVNDVKWEWYYTYAKGFDQSAFNPAGTQITATTTPSGTAYQHYVTETTGIDLSITEPDGLIYCRIARVTNGGTDNTDEIFLLTADVHYRSTDTGTVGKAPNFYTLA